MSNFTRVDDTENYFNNLRALERRLPKEFSSTNSLGSWVVRIKRKPKTRFDGEVVVETIPKESMELSSSDFVTFVEELLERLEEYK